MVAERPAAAPCAVASATTSTNSVRSRPPTVPRPLALASEVRDCMVTAFEGKPGMNAARIIADVHLTDRHTLEVAFSCPPRLSRFFFEKRFRARYSVPIDTVPEPLLIIPFLANILPFAWLLDASVEVGTVDAVFADSIQRVRAGFQTLYPALLLGGSLDAREIVPTHAPESARTAMLFSGGLDSVVTYALHADEHPLLITVGSTAENLETDETWEAMRSDVEAFARVSNTSNLIVLSNLRRMFNARALDTHFRHAFTNWWGGIQHGFGMTGLAAPLSNAVGFSRLYIASTLSRTVSHPWGSDPLIDDEIAWSYLRVRHDAYDLNRHQKIAVFAKYREQLGADLPLRVCDHAHGSVRNCGRCEKCCRTMTGLVLHGVDPTGVGFPPLSNAHIVRQLERGAWELPRGTRSYWTDLQSLAQSAIRAASPDPIAAAHQEYLEWLAQADFEDLRRRADRSLYRRVRYLWGLLPRGVVRVIEQIRRAIGRT